MRTALICYFSIVPVSLAVIGLICVKDEMMGVVREGGQMRQFFKDLAVLVHRLRVSTETHDSYIADRKQEARQAKLDEMYERSMIAYGVIAGEAKAQTAILERIAKAAEKDSLADLAKKAIKKARG